MKKDQLALDFRMPKVLIPKWHSLDRGNSAVFAFEVNYTILREEEASN